MNWRAVFAKFQTPSEGVKKYKGENGEEIPNNAEFTGDKFPSSSGDAAEVELKAYKDGNKLYKRDKKREDESAEYGSALMSEKAKRQGVREHMSDQPERMMHRDANAMQLTQNRRVASPLFDKFRKKKDPEYISGADAEKRNEPSYEQMQEFKRPKMYVKCPSCGYENRESEFPGGPKGPFDATCPQCGQAFPTSEGDPFIAKERRSPGEEMSDMWREMSQKGGWRKALGELSFKQKPDGTVQIDISSHPNGPIMQNPLTQQPAPKSPEQVNQQEAQSGKVNEASRTKGAQSRTARPFFDPRTGRVRPS